MCRDVVSAKSDSMSVLTQAIVVATARVKITAHSSKNKDERGVHLIPRLPCHIDRAVLTDMRIARTSVIPP